MQQKEIPSDVRAFMEEIFKRLSVRSPKFFRKIRMVSLAILGITGIPALLSSLGYKLPFLVALFSHEIVAVIAGTAALIVSLTVDRTVVPTSAATLPYTAKKEAEEIAAE